MVAAAREEEASGRICHFQNGDNTYIGWAKIEFK